MSIIERYSEVPIEIWHNGILIAIVYENSVLTNRDEDVDIVFGELDDNQWRLMN